MSIRVLQPGLLTTIQDRGRFGLQQFGVIVSGAMDSLSLQISNLLVGNPPEDPVLEITLTGPVLQFEKDTLIAIAGADLSPTVDGRRINAWRPVWIKQQSRLEFGAPVRGCRAYLAVAGGFDVTLVLQSYSTYLRAGLGGFQGRSLQAGDQLNLRPASDWAKRLIDHLAADAGDEALMEANWSAGFNLCDTSLARPIRVITGGQFDWFTRASQEAFFQEEFTVTNQSDRMGYRLKGPGLQLDEPLELISEAVTMGSIQVPAQGDPIVLMADRPTTGGYPKIAQVVSADLPRLAQAKPLDRIRFEAISLDEAQQLYRTQQATLQILQCGIALMDH